MGILVSKAFLTKALRVYFPKTGAFCIAFDLQTLVHYLHFTIPQNAYGEKEINTNL